MKVVEEGGDPSEFTASDEMVAQAIASEQSGGGYGSGYSSYGSGYSSYGSYGSYGSTGDSYGTYGTTGGTDTTGTADATGSQDYYSAAMDDGTSGGTGY